MLSQEFSGLAALDKDPEGFLDVEDEKKEVPSTMWKGLVTRVEEGWAGWFPRGTYRAVVLRLTLKSQLGTVHQRMSGMPSMVLNVRKTPSVSCFEACCPGMTSCGTWHLHLPRHLPVQSVSLSSFATFQAPALFSLRNMHVGRVVGVSISQMRVLELIEANLAWLWFHT